MSLVELKYQKHLDDLREYAREEGIPFADILRSIIKSFKPGLGTVARKHAGKEEIERIEKYLIDQYRPQFFESMANKSLGIEEALMEAVINDAANLSKKYGRARKTAEGQQQNLALGRQQGTAKIKQRANVIHTLAHQINNDLLTHPDTARWTLARRAEYIQQKLETDMVEVDGYKYKATMANGKNYTVATIKTWITGT